MGNLVSLFKKESLFRNRWKIDKWSRKGIRRTTLYKHMFFLKGISKYFTFLIIFKP